MPDDQLKQVTAFSLLAGRAIDPVLEEVTIALSESLCGGVFSRLAFPAGSFAARFGEKLAFFDGTVVDGATGAPVTASVRIARELGQGFRLSLDLKNADYTCLEGLESRRVTTILVVGDDTMGGEQCFARISDGDLFFPPAPGIVCP